MMSQCKCVERAETETIGGEKMNDVQQQMGVNFTHTHTQKACCINQGQEMEVVLTTNVDIKINIHTD